jgi:hypothetical protein
MDWWQLIPLLVVVAAYIIKQIMAAQQEAAAQRDRRQVFQTPPRPKDDAEVAGERAESDRRLEEASERTGDEQRSRTTPKRHIPMPNPQVVVVKPRRVPRYEPPSRAEERALPEVVSPPRSELPRVVKPLPAKPPASIPLPPVAPEAAQLAAMMAKNSLPTAPLVPVITNVTVKKQSPAARTALEMLKNRQNIAAAFVLREVLDRPLSKRRRRIG